MVRLRAITITACAVILVAVIPLTGASASAAVPWQCSDPTANLYDYPASVAQACGFTTVPLERTVARSDGGTDDIYSINGYNVDLAQPPANFDPVTASDAQLSYYGFPPRPADVASQAAWTSEVSRLHVMSSTQFLIQAPSTDTSQDICQYDDSVDACWGGWLNIGNAYTASYIDYTEPTEVQTECNDDAVLAWTGLGGYNTFNLAQAGSAPLYESHSHWTWWQYTPENTDVVFWKLQVGVHDDIQVHVWWRSDISKFEMQVTDNSTGQMTRAAYSDQVPSNQLDLSTADYIVERPTSHKNNYIHQLRNFSTWTVNSAQAAIGGGNTKGLQSYGASDLMELPHIYDKSTGDKLEDTSGLNGDGFTGTWKACE